MKFLGDNLCNDVPTTGQFATKNLIKPETSRGINSL